MPSMPIGKSMLPMTWDMSCATWCILQMLSLSQCQSDSQTSTGMKIKADLRKWVQKL